MPEYTTILAGLATLVLLGVVLYIDLFFRRDVYNRTDPISFALLLYSFLLVLSDTGLNIFRQIFAKEVDVGLLISGLIYLGLIFVVFQFVKFAHKNFKAAQDLKIKRYLQSIQNGTTTTHAALWTALEELGTASIEPDVFVRNEGKKERRIDYLERVKALTGASIVPEEDQEKLLVTDRGVRRTAQIGYIVAFWFGLLSTIFFFLFRLRSQ